MDGDDEAADALAFQAHGELELRPGLPGLVLVLGLVEAAQVGAE